MTEKDKRYVYCSGPLFCPEEIESMSKIAKTLEDEGYGTFLPHRDGLEAHVMKMVNDPRVTNRMFRRISKFINKAIFALDIYQIVERCDYLVLNMNGRVPDEGAIVETAIAFAAGKPLIIYKNDNRTEFNGNDNSMITGLSYTFSYVDEIQKIPEELAKIVKKVGSGESPYKGKNIPPFMSKVIKFGHRVWKFLGITRIFEAKGGEYLDHIKEIAKMCEDSPEMKELNWV